MNRLLLLALGGALGHARKSPCPHLPGRTCRSLTRPILDQMLGDGLVTLEKVRVITYRATGADRVN